MKFDILKIEEQRFWTNFKQLTKCNILKVERRFWTNFKKFITIEIPL